MNRQHKNDNDGDIIEPIPANLDEVADAILNTSKNQIQSELQATHKGNFKNDFGIDVDCYVLNDKKKTAVISQTGMGVALGLGVGGSRLTSFISGKIISQALGSELLIKLSKPLVFKGVPTGENMPPPPKIHGYDVTLLIDICNKISKAASDGKLRKNQENAVRQARIIIEGSAKAGITNLVYAIAGYDATRQEIIDAYKFYIREVAREYEREFPNELYDEWYRLYKLPKPKKNRPWKFMHLTIEHVYYPLAKSMGQIHRLVSDMRLQAGERNKRLHQFLSEIGVKALKQHLGQILGIAQISESKEKYESNINRVFGLPDQLNLPFAEEDKEESETGE